jgi:hypothetical protein
VRANMVCTFAYQAFIISDKTEVYKYHKNRDNLFFGGYQMTITIELAQTQLDAYNEKNIEAFLEVYSKNVQVMEFPSNHIMYTGIERMREVYSTLFENNPNQHASLRSRIAHQNIVIDHEYITGRANGIEIEAVAMYEIENGKIAKVWFIK